MPLCSCFDGVLGKKNSTKKVNGALGDVDVLAYRSPGRIRRPSNLTAEDVFAMVHPRPGTWAARMENKGAPSLQQCFASPVPNYRNQEVLFDTDSELRRPDAFRTQQRSKFEVEQLIKAPGSLPKPLRPHERERIIRKLLPTVTHEMLAALRKDLVEATGIEGQTLRRKLTEGSTVVVFTAGYAGKRFVFERMRQLGIKTVVIEHPDSWAKDLVGEGLIAKFCPIDMSQSSEKVLEASLKIIQSLGEDGITGAADAILTFVELSVPTVARLCELLGLPGPLPSSVDQARSKHATRAALKEAGLPTPRNCLIKSAADLASAGVHVGYPAVMKPISGAASLGVKKVMCESELKGIYDEIISELSSLVVVSGALAQNDGSGKGVNAEAIVDTSILLEQYLDGQEVDVDVVVSEGEWRYAAITDNGPTLEPYFNETWGVCPSLLSLEEQRELKHLAVKSVEALGFSSGVFHVECKYTSTGPQLIEVNARMGGGPVHEMNLRSWGVDLVEEAIFIALGIPARPCVPQQPLISTAYYVVPATKSGVVDAVPNLERYSSDPDVVWAKPLVKSGDAIVGPEDGLPTWIADFLVQKASAVEARDFVWKLEEENRLTLL